MAVGRIVHWIGVAFVSIAAILLLVTSIGSPTVPDIGLLKVYLKNASDIRQSSVVFGPFGYCVLDVAPAQTDQDYCSHPSVGYLPAQEMRLLVPATVWKTWKGHDLDLMTVAYVLFPIACFIAFCAAGFAFCGVIGSLIASVLCATAFLVTFPVMVVAFVSMGYLKSHVQAQGLKANYSVAMWTCLAAFILLFFAMLLLFFSCFSGLRGKNRDKKRYNEKHSKPREDSERSLNNTHSNGHHYGRDAAVGGAGVGAYEAERHHRNKETNGRGHHDRANGLNNTRNNEHHYGRDAAVGTAGVGALEAERHHHNNQATGHGLGHNDRTNDNHHLGRDAAVGTAGVGALGAERHHHNKETSGLGHNNRTNDNHHLGRDAAVGTAGVGAIEAERHHHNKDMNGRGLGHNNRTNDNHHYGRDAAIGTAGVGALGAERHHRKKDTSGLGHNDHTDDNHHLGRDAAVGTAGVGALTAEHHHHNKNTNAPIHSQGLRHTPVNEAAARAEEGVSGLENYPQDARDTTRGNNYDSVLANQDRQNMASNSSHHYGRDAALAGGATGAGGLAAHEYERSRATPAGAGMGVAVPAPREHKLRDTMRDSSNRGYEEPSNQNQRYIGPGQGQTEEVAPVHHKTTIGLNSMTHHHPTTTTSTSTYADERGVFNTGLDTRTHDPNMNTGRGYAAGSAI